MISREIKTKLLTVFANAARIDDIENITQEQIDKMAPKIRKIFQQQYDLFHSHFHDELPEDSDIVQIAPDATGISAAGLAAITAAAGIALSKSFKSTEPEFRKVLVEGTSDASDAASKAIAKQVEQTTSHLSEAETPDNWPTHTKAEPISASLEARWDVSDPKQQTRLEERAAKMVKGIDDVTRQDIHDIITKGHGEGKSYSAIAKDIRDKYEEFSTPAPQGHIKDRAELIAVTEIRMANQSTQYEDFLDMADRGWEIEKSWSNTGDDKVSDGCLENSDAGWIPLDDEFPSGDLYPPRFPGCRCCLAFRIVGREKE